LGLLLFVIYVHDVDTNISKDTEDLTFSLDRISGNILPWFDKNRLIINKGKSLALCFHHKSNKHSISGHNIERYASNLCI